jgi:hypothetical protein
MGRVADMVSPPALEDLAASGCTSSTPTAEYYKRGIEQVWYLPDRWDLHNADIWGGLPGSCCNDLQEDTFVTGNVWDVRGVDILNIILLKWWRALIHRESANIAAPKTRPLDQKIEQVWVVPLCTYMRTIIVHLHYEIWSELFSLFFWCWFMSSLADSGGHVHQSFESIPCKVRAMADLDNIAVLSLIHTRWISEMITNLSLLTIKNVSLNRCRDEPHLLMRLKQRRGKQYQLGKSAMWCWVMKLACIKAAINSFGKEGNERALQS